MEIKNLDGSMSRIDKIVFGMLVCTVQAGCPIECNHYCVPRAIANALGISDFQIVNNTLARRIGQCATYSSGVEYRLYIPFLNSHKLFEKHPTYNLTLRDFAGRFNKGRFVIKLNGHATCLIDGVMVEDAFNSAERAVLWSYRQEVLHAWKVKEK